MVISAIMGLVVGGCASSQKKAEQREMMALKDNTRLSEQRRMLAIQRGDAGSARGAEVLVMDPNKVFDPGVHSVGGKTYRTESARTKSFQFTEKMNPGRYQTNPYVAGRRDANLEKTFQTGAADARGRYEIPNVGKAVVVNAAPTKEVWDARRTAEGKNLRDGKREYLGVEKKRTQSGIDPATLGEWRGTGETMTNTGTAVEKYSNMKTLSIEDVRELLNKNK